LRTGGTVIVGSGIDVVEIARVGRVLARHAERFATRVFTPQERADCDSFAHPVPHFALRFAAKEAAMKAVGTGWAKGVRWADIEVLSQGLAAAPRLQLHGRVAEIATSRGGTRLHLALSRSRTHALAVVLLEALPR
jgi:holo-[acyl-carrier protein] synthase